MRKNLPINWLINMQKGFDFLDKELTEMYPERDKRSDTRFVDKLVRVYKPDGRQECLLIHVEVQGQTDTHFPERMFRYYYRISDRFKMPVTTIAVFTGSNEKTFPVNMNIVF